MSDPAPQHSNRPRPSGPTAPDAKPDGRHLLLAPPKTRRGAEARPERGKSAAGERAQKTPVDAREAKAEQGARARRSNPGRAPETPEAPKRAGGAREPASPPAMVPARRGSDPGEAAANGRARGAGRAGRFGLPTRPAPEPAPAKRRAAEPREPQGESGDGERAARANRFGEFGDDRGFREFEGFNGFDGFDGFGGREDFFGHDARFGAAGRGAPETSTIDGAQLRRQGAPEMVGAAPRKPGSNLLAGALLFFATALLVDAVVWFFPTPERAQLNAARAARFEHAARALQSAPDAVSESEGKADKRQCAPTAP